MRRSFQIFIALLFLLPSTALAADVCCLCQRTGDERATCLTAPEETGREFDPVSRTFVTTRTAEACGSIWADNHELRGWTCSQQIANAQCVSTNEENGLCPQGPFTTDNAPEAPGEAPEAASIGAVEPPPTPAIIPELNVPIPGFTFTSPEGAENSLLAQYLAAFYRYGISITAVAATVMFVYGAFLYLAGSALPSISSGKRIMQEAIIGMILVFGAYTIVRIVNPELTKLPSLNVDIIKTIALENENVLDASVTINPNAPATPAIIRESFLGWSPEELEHTEPIRSDTREVTQPLQVPVFKQFSGPWANKAYGPSGVSACPEPNDESFSVARCCTTYANAGCGATALATLLAFNGVDTDPGKVGAFLVSAGARSCNFGTAFTNTILNRLSGLTGDKKLTPLGAGNAGVKNAVTSLRAGQPVMFLCQGCTGKARSGTAKSYKGHYMVLTGVDAEGLIFTVSDVGGNEQKGIANIAQNNLAKYGAAFWALQ